MQRTIPSRRISAATIEEARGRIRSEFLNSRQLENTDLSRAVGARLLCKIESENSVGSFKGRGADSFVNSLPANTGPLVTASAGNFGFALAEAARKRGIEITVYAAESASAWKLARIRSTGAELRLFGRDFDDAKEHARNVSRETNARFVEDGDEPAVTAGAGTIAMELTDSPQAIDTVLVPLGNGALLAGMGTWFRSRSPRTRIIGVCAEGAPCMAFSWRSGTPQSTASADTIADGIAARIPVPAALEDLEANVDDVVLVSDDGIRYALKLAHQHLGLVCEPAGVVGVAAALMHRSLAKGLTCTPITGGNATLSQLEQWIAGIQ